MAAMTTEVERRFLVRTPAGDLFQNDGIYFVRPAYPQRGWVTATALSPNELWVYARDRKGMARVIEITSITKIGDAPKPLPQREIKPPKRSRKGRRR